MEKSFLNTSMFLLVFMIVGCSSSDSSKGTVVTDMSVGQGSDRGTSTDGGMMSGGGGGGTSCVMHADCPPGSLCDPTDGICRVGCQSDADCGADRACNAEGFCVTPTSCGDGNSCPAGSKCDCNQRCVPAQGNACRSNLSCMTTEYCDMCSEQCKARAPQCGACLSDDGCDPRAVCVGLGRLGNGATTQVGYCARRCQGSCDVVGATYECRELSADVQACVPREGECSASTQCASDSDCPPDRFCSERMECQVGCAGDVSCPMGQVCQGLRCAPPCNAESPCPAGQECADDGHCRIPGGCSTSAECLEPETYCDREMQLCVSGCQVDNDCLDATMECLGGTCRPRGCSGNYQCAFGQICNQETNMCQDAPGNHCMVGCDPQAEMACGGEGSRCLSLQDADGNALGDFCFEACEPAPNECPKGYSCNELMDENGAAMGSLCMRDCTL